MFFLWLSSLMLLPICAVSGVWDQQCVDNCSCCIEQKCGPGVYGWEDVCTIGCIDGHRGVRCYELCQYKNCRTCVETHATCTACYDGYYLGPNKDCTLQCPPNCKSCTSNTMCTECKDGFYDKDGSTTCKYAYCPANCECNDQGDCVSCRKGYYDTSTSCAKQCPVNCLTCVSAESCKECKNGFYNGHDHNNNVNLELHNCTHACRNTCTQCQSYNNCFQCIEGKYGITCQEDCSVGCKEKTCNFDTGHCECTVGFIGEKCMKCVDGNYGLFCNKTCSKYCKNKICDRKAGDCSDGCINENISGSTCNICIAGMFGEVCDKICPENCKDSRCDRYSGHCSDGCTNNFNGTKCDLCISGKYGTDCQLRCPVNCVGKICNRNLGTCLSCDENFQGNFCYECRSSYFGANCDIPCSPHCSYSSCNRDNGKCVDGCTDGYSGDKCCVMSRNCVECDTNTECKTCVSGFFKTSCNETCPAGCSNSCDISKGECILSKETQQQKDASNTVPVSTAAVLGSLFAVAFAVNIVLLIVFLIRKRKAFRRKHSRPHGEPTYENHLGGIDVQFPQTASTDDSQTGTVDRNVYEGIGKVNEKEHEYQQVSFDQGTSSSKYTGKASRIQMKAEKQPYRLYKN